MIPTMGQVKIKTSKIKLPLGLKAFTDQGVCGTLINRVLENRTLRLKKPFLRSNALKARQSGL